MKTGRPLVEMDLNQVEIFGKFRATYETMAAYFGVSERTIKRRMVDDEDEFCHHYKKGMADFQLSLAEAQVRNAVENDNATLQIWLGKQYLGQTDKQLIEQSGTITTVTIVEEFKEDESK